jgi:membrane protein
MAGNTGKDGGGAVGGGGWMLAAAALAGLLALDAGRRGPRPVPSRSRRAPRRAEGRVAAADAGAGAAKREAGVGRDADTPSQIPARGFWQVAKRTLSQAGDDRLLTEAAGITFYTLLALFPAIAALVSLYALVADPGTIQGHLEALGGVVPGGGMDIINEQVQRVAQTAEGTLGFGVIAGLLISLWSANQAAKAVFDALNVVYEEKEKRGFVKLTLTTLGFTLGFIVFAILTMVAVVALPVVLNFIGLGGTVEALLRYGRWPLLLLLVSAVLACLYRWGPSRAKARWRWVSWGSGFAAIAWLGVSAAFSWYVSNFGNYNETYGSLGAVIGFMTWIWISSAVVLLGAEVNAELEHQTARDTTANRPERPMGQRQAEMADTVAS